MPLPRPRNGRPPPQRTAGLRLDPVLQQLLRRAVFSLLSFLTITFVTIIRQQRKLQLRPMGHMGSESQPESKRQAPPRRAREPLRRGDRVRHDLPAGQGRHVCQAVSEFWGGYGVGYVAGAWQRRIRGWDCEEFEREWAADYGEFGGFGV